MTCSQETHAARSVTLQPFQQCGKRPTESSCLLTEFFYQEARILMEYSRQKRIGRQHFDPIGIYRYPWEVPGVRRHDSVRAAANRGPLGHSPAAY